MPALSNQTVTTFVPANWLDTITTIRWNKKRDVIHWRNSGRPTSLPMTATSLTALETTHPYLRQVLRVVFAARKDSKGRIVLLRHWRKSTCADPTGPVIFCYFPRRKTASVVRGTWAVDLVYAGATVDADGEKLVELRWGQDYEQVFALSTLETNFPGFTAAYGVAEALSMDPAQTADYLKSALWAPNYMVSEMLPDLATLI
jgi:hypothetical protein